MGSEEIGTLFPGVPLPARRVTLRGSTGIYMPTGLDSSGSSDDDDDDEAEAEAAVAGAWLSAPACNTCSVKLP